MIVLVTGDRHWDDLPLLLSRMQYWHAESGSGPITLLIHGDCRGADRMGGRAAECLSIPIAKYPADWNRYGPKAGMIRNRLMLNIHSDVDLVLAFHDELRTSRGTRHMIKIALDAELLVELTTHEGVVFPCTPDMLQAADSDFREKPDSECVFCGRNVYWSMAGWVHRHNGSGLCDFPREVPGRVAKPG